MYTYDVHAGVDLESPRSISDAMTLFEQTIDEFDELRGELHGGAKGKGKH